MTFDEARLRTNVNDRAMHLFESGYRARWTAGGVLSVRSPEGDVYHLDIQAEACACPFFQKHSGRHSCKHLLGWKRLLSRQRACRLLVTLTLLRVWADLDDTVSCVDKAYVDKPCAVQEQPVQETEAVHAVS